MKEIDRGYKLSELLLSGRRGSTDAVVNVATVEFRSGAVILTKKRRSIKPTKRFGVTGSRGYAISLSFSSCH